MDIIRLNHIIANPNSSTDDELQKLKELAAAYPYSQTFHTLIARISRVKDQDYKHHLNIAAVYASDRTILKHYVLDNNLEDFFQFVDPDRKAATDEVEEVEEAPAQIEKQEPVSTQKTEPASNASAPTNTPPDKVVEEEKDVEAPPDGSSHELYEEVLGNLEKLKKLRKQYDFIEKRIEEEEKNAVAGLTDEEEAEIKPKKKGKKIKEENEEKQEEVQSDDIEAVNVTEQESDADTESKEVSNEKIEEQKKLIDRFLEKLPEIARKKPKKQDSDQSSEQEDLSKASTTFTDELVSENLAIIYLKQDKKDKAIDIYKKLIWKYPQKKAYFASRIEELNQ